MRAPTVLTCAFAIAGATAAAQYAPPAGGPEKYLETIRLADNVYVFKPRIDWTHGNGVAIIGPDGVFFIDTFLQFNYAEEAIRRLRAITTLPVRYVLNTHSHRDHAMGNAVFKSVFPSCQIIAHDSTAATFERFLKQGVAAQSAQIAGNIAQLDSELRVGRGTARSIPLDGRLRPFWQWQLQEAKEYQRQFHAEQYAPADITFSDTLTMHWGTQTLRLIHVADNGHSTGDVIVWVPETRLLVTGDLDVAPTPYATYSNIRGMITAIPKLIAMNPATIIPGHGEVQHDTKYLALVERAFIAYDEAANRAVAAKVPARAAADSIAFPDIDVLFTGDDEVKAWAYRSFFVRNLILNVYKNAGALPPPSKP